MKNSRLSDDFINLTAQLMLVRERSEIIRIAADFNTTIEKLIEKEKSGSCRTHEPQTKSVSMTLKFTTKEISSVNMAKTFKKEFIANGLVAHVIKRESGKNSYCYEIRYRSNGYKIEASSTDLAEAKRKFLEKTTPSEIEKYKTVKHFGEKIPHEFAAFTDYYFEKFRKRKVAEMTYYRDCLRVKNYLFPVFQGKNIREITPSDCQDLLDRVLELGYGKTADELRSLMSIIFKGAIAHGILERNPINTVAQIQYTQKNGKALSKEEIEKLFASLKEPEYEVAIALSLYCGLRPNEIYTARIEGDFIIAKNSKRKGKKLEYKRIPIISCLRPYLVDGIPELPSVQRIRRKIKDALPDHIHYDLRTTFYTVCRKCNVAKPALDHFVGHSEGALADAYTDLPDDYLLEEAKKIRF